MTSDQPAGPRFVKPGRAAAPAGPLPGAAPPPPTPPAPEPPPGASGVGAPHVTAAPFQSPPAIYGAGATFGPVEVIALLGIGAGWLVPGPGWLAGAVALVLSKRWTAGEKTAAIVLPWVLVAIPFLGFMHDIFAPTLQGNGSAIGWFVVLFVVGVVVWPLAAIYLWVVAARRGRAARGAAA